MKRLRKTYRFLFGSPTSWGLIPGLFRALVHAWRHNLELTRRTMETKKQLMKEDGWVRHYRNDKGVWEDICPHGVGHEKGIHGCDGCCKDLYR